LSDFAFHGINQDLNENAAARRDRKKGSTDKMGDDQCHPH
jgi:hypothetical protein